MNWNLYRDETLERRTLLDFGEGMVLTQADLSEGGIEYEECVNTGEDFTLGTASAASLKFDLLDHERRIPELTGREFSWLAGIETGRERDERAARATRSAVNCRNGASLYAGYGSKPYLRVWEQIDGGYVRQENPVQPELPTEAIFIEGGFLYCVHASAPFLTVYDLAGMTAAPVQPAPELSAFQQARLARMAQRHTCFNRQGDMLTEYAAEYLDGKPVALVSTVFEYGQAGLFRAEKPEKKNDTRLTVTAYDRMTRFDVDVSGWMNGLSWPLTALAFLQSLCAFCGVELATESFCNEGYLIQKNVSAEGVTGRQALQWVAELAASFARMTPEGKLELAWYAPVEYSLGPHDLWSMTAADYGTGRIDKLQVRSAETDVGVVVPPDETGTNAYVIEGNPLLCAETDAELRPAAEAIYSAIHDFHCRPFTAECVSNPFLRAGSIFTISTAKGDVSAVVMSRHTGGGKDRLEATGNQVRAVQSSGVNQQISRLRGRTNELDRTIEETKSTLTDTARNLQSQITQQAGEISLKVSKDNIISEINASPESIRIQAEKVAITGFVTFDDLSTAGSTTINGSNIRTGSISANRISGGTLEGVEVISDGGYGQVRMADGSIWIQDSQIYQSSRGSLYIEASYAPSGGGGGIGFRTAGAGDAVSIYNNGRLTCFNGLTAEGGIVSENNLTVQGAAYVGGNFTVNGTKSCVQHTQDYGGRIINAYETAEYYFGDIGEGTVSGGECRVEIDPVFLQCINTAEAYQVFLTPYGPGMVYVAERAADHFVVRGDDIPFAWELKAKRRGYEHNRLEEFDMESVVSVFADHS